jgi:hypothetical protein
MVVVLGHLNNLTVILQQKCFLVHKLYTGVKTKIFMFSKQVKENKVTHFATLQRIRVSSCVASKYRDILSKLQE